MNLGRGMRDDLMTTVPKMTDDIESRLQPAKKAKAEPRHDFTVQPCKVTRGILTNPTSFTNYTLLFKTYLNLIEASHPV